MVRNKHADQIHPAEKNEQQNDQPQLFFSFYAIVGQQQEQHKIDAHRRPEPEQVLPHSPRQIQPTKGQKQLGQTCRREPVPDVINQC